MSNKKNPPFLQALPVLAKVMVDGVLILSLEDFLGKIPNEIKII